jgi:hypothetical protein
VAPAGGAGGRDFHIGEQFIRFHSMSAQLDGGRRKMLPWTQTLSECGWL